MLNKKTLQVGDHVVVKDVIKDGVTLFAREPGENVLPCLSVSWDRKFPSPKGEVKSGAVLEIVKRPRRVGRINLVRIRYGVSEGEVYWCELRISTKVVPKSSPLPA